MIALSVAAAALVVIDIALVTASGHVFCRPL
jgi:hypothetical protein